MTTFSLVVCSIDAAKFERATASWRRALAPSPCEVVGIHDARSLAEGYTRGLARATGDIVVFSHDDVDVVTLDAGAVIERHLRTFDVIGIAGTRRLVGGAWYLAGDPHDFMLVISPNPTTGRPVLIAEGAGPLVVPGMQALDGVLFATHAATARDVGFDARTFDGWHLYDLDFTFRAHLGGRRLAVCRDLLVVHASSGSFDAAWDDYRRRFEAKFAGRLPPTFTRTEPRILNMPIDPAALADASRRAELASAERLAALVARLVVPARSSAA